MIVLGIDPGSRITGFGIVRQDGRKLIHIDNGGIAPSAKEPLGERLATIYRETAALIATHHPDMVALENVFVAKNVRSAMLLGHVRGVVWLAATQARVAVTEYAPTEVKQALVGNGHATKSQIQEMTRRVLALPEIAHEDAADALAVAVCHCQSMGLATAIARATEARTQGVLPA